MALDPNKKRTPEELARLQQAANPLANTLASRIGRALASKRDTFNAAGQIHDQQQQAALAARTLPKPQPSATVQPAAPSQKPAMQLITPDVPGSLNIAPPTRNAAPQARSPVSPGASAGATTPAGGVPAPRTIDGRPDSVASGVNAQGNNVYDNASIAALQARNGAAAAGVGSQAFGGLPMPVAAAAPQAQPQVQPQPQLGVDIPRPARADAYNVRQANEQNKAISDEIQSQLFRNSFAVGRGSRSARDLQGQLLQTLAGIGGKQLDVAAGVAGGDRDAAARYDLAGVEQQGANQRATLGDTGATNRTLIGESGANQRAALEAIPKPQSITDANGNLLQVTGTQAAPVLGADGKPVKSAATKADGQITPAIQLDALTKQLAAETGALEPNQERIGALQQQISALTAGNGGDGVAPSGYTLVGTTKDGKKVYRDANGKTYSE